MLNDSQKKELQELVRGSLVNAEDIWKKIEPEMGIETATFSVMTEALKTDIPGYGTLEMDKPCVDDFIAIVVDMRDSTKHLLQKISHKTGAKVNQLQRIFYETSALLPALAKVVSYHNGSVTEYLGDGVLGLFQASESSKPQCIYDAHKAAKRCLQATDEIVNPILSNRYGLPALKIGIGLAYSRAVVTPVGLPEKPHPKVFGECVFRASKLSGGVNQIYVDEPLHGMWPTRKGSKLRLTLKNYKGLNAYLVEQSV